MRAARSPGRSARGRRSRRRPAAAGWRRARRVGPAAGGRARGAPRPAGSADPRRRAPCSRGRRARSSSRSAWRSAASRTARCWAITASCGFGSTSTGTRRATRPGRPAPAVRENRGRNSAGVDRERLQRVAPLAPDEPVGLGGFVDGRDRCVEVDVLGRGVADAGKPTASSSARETRSPSPPSASTASAVSPSDGRARTTATSRTSTADDRDRDADHRRRLERDEPGDRPQDASATTTAARAIQARRTMRRSHSRRRCGRSVARSASSDGSSGPVSDWRGSGGMTAPLRDRRRRARRRRSAEADGCGRSSSAVLGGTRAPRRSRQRRVGETAWTDRNRKMTDRTSQVTTLFGHSASRVGPNGCGRLDDVVDGRRSRDHARRRRWHDDIRPRRTPLLGDRPAPGRASERRRCPLKTTPSLRRDEAGHDAAPAAAERGLGAAQDVGLGDERVEVGEDRRCADAERSGRRLPLSSKRPIACQKTRTKTVPMVMARTPKIVIAVAAVVRLTRLEHSSPNAPSPSAVTIRTM